MAIIYLLFFGKVGSSLRSFLNTVLNIEAFIFDINQIELAMVTKYVHGYTEKTTFLSLPPPRNIIN